VSDLFWWDACNKWLYIGSGQKQGKQFVILLDEWIQWFCYNPMKHVSWTLFSISWDHGSFWADDLRPVRWEGEMAVKFEGKLTCYVQLTLFGVGFRKYYTEYGEVEMVDDIRDPTRFKHG
jgi:hypothetical protein